MYRGIGCETKLSDDTWAVNIGIPQSITWFITCRLHQQSSILCTCGASWLHWRWWHRQNQTGEHADCWFPAPVWFSGYRPSPPTHHRQVELPTLTTTLPCHSPVYVSTHGKYLYTCISKNLHVYTISGYKEFSWNTLPRPAYIYDFSRSL